MKICLRPVLAIFTLLVASTLGYGQVVINEYVSSNVDSLFDEDGRTPDWIELKNLGPNTVNLGGWGLSDDPGNPFQWVFPDRYLQAGELLTLHASGEDRRIHYNELRTVITLGDSWSYLPGTQAPPAAWRAPTFDDSSWATGSSGFGFGDADDATVVQADTVYLRKTFQLPSSFLDQLTIAYLHVDIDDGFVAYLNGVEIARQNLGLPGDFPAFNRRARKELEARLYQDWGLQAIPIEEFRSLIRPGINVISIQAHNATAQGDDLSVIPMITIGMTNANPVNNVFPKLLFPEPLLHTNFKLDALGDSIVLTRPDGGVEDQVDTGPMYTDVSRGRHGAGLPGQWYLHFPSPGKPNGTSAMEAFAEPVEISPPSGRVSAGELVVMSHPSPGATIYYTLDGSEPSLSSLIYSGPFPLVGPVAVVRARAFQSDLWPSWPTTRTYIEQGSATVPVFSLVTDPLNLWDPLTGIYANWTQDWERPVHVDMIGADGLLETEFDGGIRIHGGLSRWWRQKSFRILTRGGYGLPSLGRRLFRDEGLDNFKRFVLRNGGTDWLRAHLRDGFTSRLIRGEDLDHAAFRPAVVVLNGEYWGVQNIRERMDKHFVAGHRGVDPDQIDLVEMVGRGTLRNMKVQANQGDSEHWNAMIAYLLRNPMSDPANYAQLQTLLDTDNFATYQIIEIFVANTDWPHHNSKFWRERTPTGRWRGLLYDADNGLGAGKDASHNTLHYAIGLDNEFEVNGTFLFRELLTSEVFRNDFINRYADYLNTRFRTDRALEILAAMEQELDPEMDRQTRRWNSQYSTWVAEVDKVELFCQQRPARAFQHILKEFGLAGPWTFDLDIVPAGSGRVRLTAIDVTDPFTGVYFLGVPVRAEAVPAEGFEFDAWSDSNLPPQSGVLLDPGADYALTAHFLQVGPALQINEINYKSATDFDPGDWVELHNNSDQAIDLSGWEFRDEGAAFVIPNGAMVAPRGFLVLCQDLATFQVAFPSVTQAIGDLGFGLKGTSEELRLFDDNGVLRDQLHYLNQPPWPIPPAGQGPTLELLRPALDNSDGRNWRSSAFVHGTPGASNSARE